MTTLLKRARQNRRNGTLAGLVLRRLVASIPLIILVIVATFLLIRLAPGDPATLLAGDSPAPEMVAKIRTEYGLDKPLATQLGLYVKNSMTLNFGTSIYYQAPVIDVIFERVPATMLLTGTAMLMASLLGIVLGVSAARHKGRREDMMIGAASMLGYSLPAFWIGQLLILLFAVSWQLLPAGGMNSATNGLTGLAYLSDLAVHLILPAITLMTFELGLITRFTRTAMIEALDKEYVLVARAKGASMDHVVWTHAFPNAVVTTITIMGLEFGVLLAGAVVTETVFSWPGLGRLFYDAITQRDFPLLNGCFIFASVMVIAVNLLTDVATAALDPRVRR
ncbi:peptide/nickel transport system permease protein [Caballeronia udeis]|uniref:Peptide/nickel transport system permease protein n=1 Tax=Caballeronia udeis TaxID=1232866 RepID=A0ABW8MW27_9BURK